MTGEIKAFSGSSAPSGHLICNGAAVSRSTYSALFAICGTSYGVGDGSTTFGLPNFYDRFPVGSGSSYANGAAAGSSSVTLLTNQIPSHKHSVNCSVANGDSQSPDSNYLMIDSNGSINIYGSQNETTMGADMIGEEGGGLGHENRPPYLAVLFIIET